MRGACQSDLTGPSLFRVSAQPCVFPCLNIKAALSVDLCASIQNMLFCPKISSMGSVLKVEMSILDQQSKGIAIDK